MSDWSPLCAARRTSADHSGSTGFTSKAPDGQITSDFQKSCQAPFAKIFLFSPDPNLGVKPVRRSAGDGVKQRGHRGEREVSRKTIARGMPGRSGVTVVTTLVCFFVSHARLRVHRAPGIPCALCFLRAERSCKTSGISCRGIAESYLKLEQRHCEEQRDEAIHSSLAAPWIASRSLSSGAHSRDPLARNHRQQ